MLASPSLNPRLFSPKGVPVRGRLSVVLWPFFLLLGSGCLPTPDAAKGPAPNASVPSNIEERIHAEGDATSSDSRFRVEGELPAGSTWLWVRVEKGEDASDQFVAVAGEKSFQYEGYLRFGPGDYRVSTLVTRARGRHDGQRYRMLEERAIRNEDERDLRDLAPSQRVESESAEIVDLARELTEDLDSDREKALAIHDWIARNIDYDVAALGQKRLPVSSALQTLGARKAVCNGYSHLYAALARASGIPSRLIVGDARLPDGTRAPHQWNELWLDGRWVPVDATWDAGAVDVARKVFERQPMRRYFDPSESTFRKTHRAKRILND